MRIRRQAKALLMLHGMTELHEVLGVQCDPHYDK